MVASSAASCMNGFHPVERVAGEDVNVGAGAGEKRVVAPVEELRHCRYYRLEGKDPWTSNTRNRMDTAGQRAADA